MAPNDHNLNDKVVKCSTLFKHHKSVAMAPNDHNLNDKFVKNVVNLFQHVEVQTKPRMNA